MSGDRDIGVRVAIRILYLAGKGGILQLLELKIDPRGFLGGSHRNGSRIRDAVNARMELSGIGTVGRCHVVLARGKRVEFVTAGTDRRLIRIIPIADRIGIDRAGGRGRAQVVVHGPGKGTVGLHDQRVPLGSRFAFRNRDECGRRKGIDPVVIHPGIAAGLGVEIILSRGHPVDIDVQAIARPVIIIESGFRIEGAQADIMALAGDVVKTA